MAKRWMQVATMLVALVGAAGQVHAQDASSDTADDPGSTPEMPSSDELNTIKVDSLVPQKPEAQPDAEGGPRKIEDIVVTAQKTKQSLQKVPISVTAVGGEFIKETGSVSLADVALYVPNVRVDVDDPGSPQMFIRGFGTNSFNPSFEASVGFVQDDIFYGRAGYFTESMFDIDRVEVLRGPQGTLFGKNTVAGVFNVTTVAPEGDLSSEGRFTYGSNASERIEAGIGGDIGDWGGARAAVMWQRRDGQLYNEYLQRNEENLDQKAGRVRLRWYTTPSLRTDLLVQKSTTHTNFWPFQLYKLDADTRTYLQSFDPNVEDNPYNFLTEFDTPGFLHKGSDTASTNTQWQLGDVAGIHDFTSVLVLGYSKFFIDQLNELDVSPADIARLDSHERHKQLSAELRFSGSGDDLFGLGTGVQFVAGAFYYHADYNLLANVIAGKDLGSYLLTSDFRQLAGCGQQTPDPTNPTSPQFNPVLCSDGTSIPGIPLIGTALSQGIGDDYYRFDYDQAIDSTALFGQFTWDMGDSWALTPGLRISSERKKVFAAGNSHCPSKDNGTGNTPCAMGTMVQANDYTEPNLRRREFNLSPKLTLQYFLDSEISFYTSWAKGFKSGGFNAISFSGDKLEYDAENAQTYELGAKTQFLENTLRFNATLYLTKFNNLQVLAFNGVFFDVSNAAAARSRGLEADVLWLTPWEPLKVMSSLGILDARYDTYTGAPAPVRNPETGELQIGAKQDLSGKRIAFAPKASGTLTPVLDFPLWNLMGRLAGDVIYQGDQYTDTDLDRATYVPSYIYYNARFTVHDVLGRWSVTLGGKNLTDKRVLNQVTDATFFPGTYFAQQAAGRFLFAAVSVKF